MQEKRAIKIYKINNKSKRRKRYRKQAEKVERSGRERDVTFSILGRVIFPQKKPCFFLTFLYPKLIFVGREFSRAFLYAYLSQGGHIKGAKLL